MADAQKNLDALNLGLKAAGEVVVPGGSNLIKGDFKQGGIHAALGLLAKIWFGLPGLALVSADSFTKAVSGQHLFELLGDRREEGRSEEEKPHHPATRAKS